MGYTYQSRWETFAAAIKAAVPSAQQTGPGACCGTGFPISFAKDQAGKIVLLTYHHYVGAAADASSTADKLLMPDVGLVSDTKALAAAASSNNIAQGFRWGEINTFSGRGKAGVSDAHVSALWGIDTCSSPIVEVNSQVTGAAPNFYAMLLVSHAGSGPILSTTTSIRSLNFSSYAISQADGSTNIILVNKDTTRGVNANVDVGAAVTGATATYLRLPTSRLLDADFTFFGGLYRDVHVLITDPVQIDTQDYASSGVYLDTTEVSKSSAKLRARVRVQMRAPRRPQSR